MTESFNNDDGSLVGDSSLAFNSSADPTRSTAAIVVSRRCFISLQLSILHSLNAVIKADGNNNILITRHFMLSKHVFNFINFDCVAFVL